MSLMPDSGSCDASAGNDTPAGSSSAPVACHPLCRCVKCRPLAPPSPGSGVVVVENGAEDDDADDDDAGVTLLAKDDRGFSALHVAALFDQTSMVELLVDLGALVNAADHYGRTPLHLACMRGGQKAVSKGKSN